MYLNDIEEEMNEREPEINYSDDDEDNEESEFSGSRASTIVKVLRLERSVRQINQKLSEIDSNENNFNDIRNESDIVDLKNEISKIKEDISVIKAQLEDRENPPVKETEKIALKDDSSLIETLQSRVEENEKKIDTLTKKHVDGFQAQVTMVSTKISFVLFLMSCAGFLIHAYYAIGSKKANSSNLDKIIKMDDTLLDSMMIVALISFIPLFFSILGLFYGKGKRGKAFAGIILSIICILIYGVLAYTDILSI